MKFFVCFALIAVAAQALASPTNTGSAGLSGSSSGGAVALSNQDAEADQGANQGYGDLSRFRKSAYGGGASYGATVQAPPCPKNYLFSCQPSLAPVPCAAPAAASYGSPAGAYSSPVATYVSPNYHVPQHHQQLYSAAYLPQAYGYNY